MIPDRLVSAAWLADHLHEPDLVVLDATKFLATPGGGPAKDSYDAYVAAHIPGARYFDVDAIADTESSLPHMVPASGRFARLVGALGVGDSSTIVFYDQNATMWATRGWWLMGLFGHTAAVLDGGLAAWRAAGHPVETGKPAPVEPAHLTPRLRAERLRGLADMLHTDAVVLDARSRPRFAGSAPEPRPGVAPGHIPGAINLPYSDLIDADGRFLDPDRLRTRLLAAGAGGTRPVVTSCGSGVSATIITMALRLAGLPEGAVYDGSWSEWGADPTTPKEVG